MVCVVYFKLIRAEKKESMDEQTCRDSRDWEEYFEGNFQLLSFIKPDTYSFDTNFNCNINNEEGVNRFVDYYMKERNETIKQRKRINREMFLM